MSKKINLYCWLHYLNFQSWFELYDSNDPDEPKDSGQCMNLKSKKQYIYDDTKICKYAKLNKRFKIVRQYLKQED